MTLTCDECGIKSDSIRRVWADYETSQDGTLMCWDCRESLVKRRASQSGLVRQQDEQASLEDF